MLQLLERGTYQFVEDLRVVLCRVAEVRELPRARGAGHRKIRRVGSLRLVLIFVGNIFLGFREWKWK